MILSHGIRLRQQPQTMPTTSRTFLERPKLPHIVQLTVGRRRRRKERARRREKRWDNGQGRSTYRRLHAPAIVSSLLSRAPWREAAGSGRGAARRRAAGHASRGEGR
eukprot:5043476-Pleurochrysis_carterae.AAC.1